MSKYIAERPWEGRSGIAPVAGALLKSSFPVVALIVCGVALRMWFCLPAHSSVVDADNSLVGLCALDVLDGRWPLFLASGYRLGSMGCYTTAGLFTLFGRNRAALGGTPVLFGGLFLVFMYLAMTEVAGRKGAVVALPLLVLPPMEFWWATYPAWGAYVEIAALSAVTIWLGLRLMKDFSDSTLRALLYGIVVGLALWCSPQSLAVSVPMTILLLLRRLSLRACAAACVGAMAGVAPYLIAFLRGDITPLSSTYAHPVVGFHQLISNLAYFATVNLPMLLFSRTAGDLASSPRALIQAVLLVSIVVVALVISWPQSRRALCNYGAGWLPLLILICSAGFFAASSAGSIRLWTVRYVVQAYLLVPLVFAMVYVRASSRTLRYAVAACALALSILNCFEYPFFNGAREREKKQFQQQLKAINWAENQHLDAVIGNYFTVYSWNLDSDRRFPAVPIDDSIDFFRFGDALRQREVKVGLVERGNQRLCNWMQSAHLNGQIARFGDNLFVAAIDGEVPGSTLQEIGAACFVTKVDFSPSKPPTLVAAQTVEDKSDCGVDSIDGMSAGAVSTSASPANHQNSLYISGWAGAGKDGIAPDEVYLNLRSGATNLFARAQTLFNRPDVAQALHQPGLLRSGFRLAGGPVPAGIYKLIILQLNQNRARQCGAVFQVVVH